MSVAIIDYKMGNIGSVVNACESLGKKTTVASNPKMLRDAEHIILPGVGAFGDGIINLNKMGWIELLELEIKKGKPFLGICLGMHLLATTGTETGIHKGLNWVPGIVSKIEIGESGLRLPHIGWNNIKIIKKSELLKNINDGADFYYLHSYCFHPKEPSVVSSICEYGISFAASVEYQNIFATQFHPEKSHKTGLIVLKNFLNLNL